MAKTVADQFSEVLATAGVKRVQSDVMSARKAGLKPTLFTVQAPNRYEKCLYAPGSGAPRLLRSAAAGAARAARLGHQEATSRWQVIADIGADVAGPMLTGFVLWTMYEARRRNLNRLYFVARDGQILQRIAVKLNAWLGWGMELRYLYASRQSLFLPSLTALDGAAIEWLTEHARFKTLGAVLSRVEIEPQTEVRLLSASGFPPESWDETLGAEGESRLRALLSRRDLGSRVLAEAQFHRATLLDYLGQERLTDGTPFGLVDIGWRGRLQASLANALGTMPDKIVPSITGFYYGLSRLPKSGTAGELLAFTKRPFPNAALLETFAKADHGSVRRFRRLPNGMVEPELLETEDCEAMEWGLAAQQGGTSQFVDLMLTVLKPADAMPQVISGYLRERGRAAFNRFAHFPSPAEGIAYGMLRHAADQTHSNPIETAPEIKRGRLLRLLTKHPYEVVRQTIWPEGSIARSTTTIERRALQTLWRTRSRTLACLRKLFIS
jgi:hypothetical protein